MGGVLIAVVLMALLLAAILVAQWGARSWGRFIGKLREELQSGRPSWRTGKLHPAGLPGLPEPVRNYFLRALEPGQPLVQGVKMRHSGRFRMGESKWVRFTSEQHVNPMAPGFIWNARIRMFPGMDIHVCDAFVRGAGILKARLLGAIPVMEEPPSPELDQGELLRFVAESVWYPTAILPSSRVSWEAVDNRSARVHVRLGDLQVKLIFRFGADHLVQSVYCADRFRKLGNRMEPTPWEGRFWNYADRDGIHLPLSAEVAWIIDGQRQPYWQGELEYVKIESRGGG